MEERVYRGQIYYIHQTEVTGSEQEGGRPAVIVSNDVGNEYSRVVEVVFLTTKEKAPLPTHVAINSTSKPSTALCEQIESIDKSRIGRYINEVSPGEMKRLEKAMLLSLQIDTTLRGTKALEEWRKMMEEVKKKEELEASSKKEQVSTRQAVREEMPIKARGEASQLLVYCRSCYKKMGWNAVRLGENAWRTIYSKFYNKYTYDKFDYVDAAIHLYDVCGGDERCNMLIAVTYKYQDSNSRYRLEIYNIDRYDKMNYIRSMEVTEDEHYISALENTYLIDHSLIHINDIMYIVEGISAVLPREAVPALFSITHEFVLRCCREIDWSYRKEEEPSSDTVLDIEKHPTYIKALAERDVYEKLYKDLLGSIRADR